jgi:tetratricopeptide (TPR) repeat protein
MPASAKIFLSTVSDEFRAYRDQLRSDLTRPNVEVKVQEDFKDQGRGTLDALDVYIAGCDAVVHLAGDMTGSAPGDPALRALRAKYPDLADKLPPLGEALQSSAGVSYTQWEAWLALYHGKLLFIAKATETAERGPNHRPTDASRAAQATHLERLKAMDLYPGCTFARPDNLTNYVLSSALFDLLVNAEVVAYAKEVGGARDLAEGFIGEMARKVAGDKALDLEGKKEAVRTAIEFYEKKIAGRPAETNFGDIVDLALAKARTQVDKGQSALARATLDKASEDMAREEEERRERYVASLTVLRHRERDIALAGYDGDAAATAILKLARAIHGTNAAMVVEFLGKEAQTLYEYGDDRGSNVHLVAAIEIQRELLTFATSDDERGAARNDLGNTLEMLGKRESGTARLDEAVAAFRAALEERTRERVPLDWAATQNNLGNALWALGERESGTARLEEAVAAYRAALQEQTRERAPVDWAATQNNLGVALWALGKREGGTARLEEAVAAYRAALEERTRERVPPDWAATQNNLGVALGSLGERESGTARLEEAVAAYRAALEERTRERVPPDWAATQANLGNALRALGEREGKAGRVEEAVAAYRLALKELKRERVPLQWAMTQTNLGNALRALGEREGKAGRVEEAVAAFRAALGEQTRERVPLDWAMTQSCLGLALQSLGERENGTARLDEAVAAHRAALQEWARERVPLDWAMTQTNLGTALWALGEREGGTARLEEAVAAYRLALQELMRERAPFQWATTQNNLGSALRALGEQEGGTARLEEAVLAWSACLEVTRTVWPPEWVRRVEGRRDEALAEIARRSAK